MESLFIFQQGLLASVSNEFRRFLHGRINWKLRMIGIKGPRGAGKTTLMLQHLKYDLGDSFSKALYVTADHTYFYNHSLLDTAIAWYQQGGRILLIDEVHKYARWSRELKNIYDGLPEMQVIFSASSALDIFRGEADLSRRVIHYNLPGLSLREYIEFSGGPLFEPLTMDDIRENHVHLTFQMLNQWQPLPVFQKYVKHGYLPIIADGESDYLRRLEQVINAIVDTDLAYIASYNAGTAQKVKRLLSVIAESAPFKPNISALASKLDIARDRIYEYIHQLKDAKLLNILTVEGKGVSRLQKPEKLYLENTNLAFAMNPRPDRGNLRETFLLNQLLNSGATVWAPKSGDFKVGDVTIEVGGRGKSAKQVANAGDYLIAADDLEAGFGNKIPLWLFGFLY